MTDDEITLIEETVSALSAKQDKYNLKSSEIDQVKTGFYIITSDAPKNTDCTDMSPEQIQTAKTNLLDHAGRIMEWKD